MPGAPDEHAALACAERVAAATVAVLGDDALGVVLHGSLAMGGYLPGRSDVDLLVVAARPLLPSGVEELTAATLTAAADWPARVDYRLVLAPAAARPTREPPMELWIEIDGRLPGGQRVHIRRAGERDLVLELSICRALGQSLHGASPGSLIGAVPPAWVDQVGLTQIEDWIEIGEDLRFAQMTVLTACRIWRFKEERVHCSKSEAGRWALGRDPTLAVVRMALDHRERDPATPIPTADVARLLSLVRGRFKGMELG